RGRSKLLEYDPARRALFQDSFTVRKGEPMNLHAVYYALTPQREARTVSLTLEPPARTLAATPGLGIRKDIRIADEGLAAGVRYRLRNDGDEAIELSFTSTSISRSVVPRSARWSNRRSCARPRAAARRRRPPAKLRPVRGGRPSADVRARAADPAVQPATAIDRSQRRRAAAGRRHPRRCRG